MNKKKRVKIEVNKSNKILAISENNQEKLSNKQREFEQKLNTTRQEINK